MNYAKIVNITYIALNFRWKYQGLENTYTIDLWKKTISNINERYGWTNILWRTQFAGYNDLSLIFVIWVRKTVKWQQLNLKLKLYENICCYYVIWAFLLIVSPHFYDINITRELLKNYLFCHLFLHHNHNICVEMEEKIKCDVVRWVLMTLWLLWMFDEWKV